MSHFCILPWVQASVRQDGAVAPCCVTDEKLPFGSLGTSSVDDIWNGERMRKLRLSLLKGESPAECRTCHVDEERGLESKREHSLRHFASKLPLADATGPDGSVSSESVLSLDLRLSNVCNFRCRTCGPNNSTAWHRDGKTLELEPVDSELSLRKTNPAFWTWLEKRLPTVEEIHFAGGEPLLHPDHYEILEKLLALGRDRVRLSYNTNLSVSGFRHWDAAALWERFRSVQLFVSLDGVGAAGELLRKGLDWDATEKRYLELRTRLPRARLMVQITVSAMNCFHLIPMLDRLIKSGMIREPDDFGLILVNHPDYLALDVLNAEEGARLRETYRTYLASLSAPAQLHAKIESSLASVLAALSSEPKPELRKTFRRTTIQLDRARQESFIREFPEHLGLLYGQD